MGEGSDTANFWKPPKNSKFRRFLDPKNILILLHSLKVLLVAFFYCISIFWRNTQLCTHLVKFFQKQPSKIYEVYTILRTQSYTRQFSQTQKVSEPPHLTAGSPPGINSHLLHNLTAKAELCEIDMNVLLSFFCFVFLLSLYIFNEVETCKDNSDK